MSNDWKDILDRAGDDNLGATLIRLARQATALHQYQNPAMFPQTLEHGSAGADPDPMVPAQPGNVRMEVNA